MWANANVMAALPNIAGALCLTPQSLADAHYQSSVQQRCQDAKPVEINWGTQTRQSISVFSGPKFTILWGHGDICLTFFSDCRYMP